jgi:hypothetical protein
MAGKRLERCACSGKYEQAWGRRQSFAAYVVNNERDGGAKLLLRPNRTKRSLKGAPSASLPTYGTNVISQRGRFRRQLAARVWLPN